jgi:hypothetical protein
MLQVPQMTRVQQIEDAVREYHGASLGMNGFRERHRPLTRQHA